MRQRLLGAAVVTAGFAMISGCVPSLPFAPLAVLAQGSTVEVRYTDCHQETFKSARLIRLKPHQKVIDGSESVLWKVDFAQPVSLRSVTIGGEAPAGGVVSVTLAEPIVETAVYDVSLEYDNGAESHQNFELDKLKDGHVMFQDKYVTRDEFDRATKCA